MIEAVQEPIRLPQLDLRGPPARLARPTGGRTLSETGTTVTGRGTARHRGHDRKAGRKWGVALHQGGQDFIAFGFGEVVNPAREEGVHMHPVAWTITSLDADTEATIRALVNKAADRHQGPAARTSLP